MSLADAFEIPAHSSSKTDERRHSRPEAKLFAAATSSSLVRDDHSYSFGALSFGESPLGSSSSTHSTLLGLQNPRARSFLSRNSASYYSKQSVEEIDLEDFDGSLERMESLVSRLLQEDGREYQSSAAKLPVRGSRNGFISSPGTLQGVNDLRMAAGNNYVGFQYTRGCDDTSLSRSLNADGRLFPLEEGEGVRLIECGDTSAKDQIQSEEDQVQLADNISTGNDNLNRNYFSDLETARGESMNPSVHMTHSTPQGHVHVGARKLNAMNGRERGSHGRCAPNAHVMKICNERPDHANETIKLKHENLVSELRMIAANIELGGRVQSNSSETPNDALGTFCNLPHEKICLTSTGAELRKVEKKFEETRRRRLYNQRMCSGPATSTFETSFANYFSSARGAKATGNSSFASAVPMAHYSLPVDLRSPMPAHYAEQGHPANNANIQNSSLGSTTEKQSGANHRDRMLTVGPPKRIFPSNNRSRAAVKPIRASDNEFYPKFNKRVSSRTPPRASQFSGDTPPIRRNNHQLQKAGIAVTSTNNTNVFKVFDHGQASALTKQKSAADPDETLVVLPAARTGCKINVNSSRQHENAPTKLFIARGAKSISILLNSEESPVSAGKNLGPPHGGSSITTKDSPPTRHARHRQTDLLNEGSSLQLVPIEHPSMELNVCNQGQLKTELCNNWQEAKFCPYGKHCRFAHGMEELRCVLRHPRYKTIPCRMVMNGKVCIYGHRCHFRHSLTTEELCLISVLDVHNPTIRQGHLYGIS